MANSPNSQPKGKRNTTKISKLIPEAALEILSQSFLFVEQSGVTLEVIDDGRDTIITIRDTKFEDGVIIQRKSVTP